MDSISVYRKEFFHSTVMLLKHIFRLPAGHHQLHFK